MKPLTCKRCGHQWYRRRPEYPKVCPVCKRADWNVAKKPEKQEAA